MWGAPKDVEGECNAHLYLGDDYGDGTCTVRCQKPEGHRTPHREQFKRDVSGVTSVVVIEWEEDEREHDED